MNKIYILILPFIMCSCVKDPIKFGNIKNFKVQKFENNILQGKLDVELNNSSFFDLKIETGELHAFSDNIDLGLVKLQEPVVIEGHTNKLYSIIFSVEITNPEAGMFSLLGRLAGKKPVYSLQGTVNAKAFLYNKKITVNEVLGK
jgi:hypothetical protein